MGCRNNQASLTTDQRKAFVNALIKLKNEVPSQMGLSNRYDDYVQVHTNAMAMGAGWAHQRPAFLPWHREFLRHFELDLQAIDPTVTIPYWDWTVDQDPTLPTSPFTDDFMGGNGSGADNKVTTGAFAEANGKWPLNINQDGITFLMRQFASNGAATLPSSTQLGVALGKTVYDASPYNSGSMDGFRNFLEGWVASGPGAINQAPQNHNRVHVWVGGSMLPATSPNDPVFWLNHCNIDRQWGIWQAMHPAAAPYLPVSGAPAGHNLNDTMIFFQGGPAPWPDTSTPAGVVDNHALGYWYDTDAPEVLLLTPSVSFVDVQQGIGGTGVTTYRPIKFECESCGNIVLEITAGPTSGFSAPSLTETVDPDEDPIAGLFPGQGALWIAYTSGAAGSSITGSVTVQATDITSGTVFGPWVVVLSANTVARQASAVALVLDRSGSMAIDAGNGQQRVELLRTAASTFVDLMQPGDGLSIVRFDNLVDTLMTVTDVGAIPGGAGRTTALDILTSHDPAKTIDPRGSTSIGGGIVQGKAALDAASGTYSNRAMIVLTDGLENTAPMIADVSSSLNDHTFAIGFGQAAAISTSALNAITQNHGGYLIVTGPVTPEETFALTEYFLKIQANINNSSAVLDPRGELIHGATYRIPFTLTSADYGADVVLLSPAPYFIDFRLETPDGRIIDPGTAASQPAISFVSTPRVSYYRASLPMLMNDTKGSHAGVWHVLLCLNDKAKDGDRKLLANLKRAALPYSLLVHAYSDLTFKPNVLQSGFEPGATVNISVVLKQYDVALNSTATVWAEVSYPAGGITTLQLNNVGPGRYAASFVTSDLGVYTVLVKARGVTLQGEGFQREERFTVPIFIGGNQGSPKPADNSLCKIVDCLLSEKAAIENKELRSILNCMEKCCNEDHGQLGGETPFTPGSSYHAPTVESLRLELQNALAAFAHKDIQAPAHFAELVKGAPIPKIEEEPMIMNFGISSSKHMKGKKKGM